MNTNNNGMAPNCPKITSPQALAKMEERQKQIEQAKIELEKLEKEKALAKISETKKMDKLVKKISQEKNTTIEVGTVREILKLAPPLPPEPQTSEKPFKPKKVKHIITVGNEQKGYTSKAEEIEKEIIEADEWAYEQIGKRFGEANITDSITPDGYVYSLTNNTQNLRPFPQDPFLNPLAAIPTYDGEKMVSTGKSFYEQNKDAMQQQMNVVAMYSIKDSKPFYYISSAEARMAIDYINAAREYKNDVLAFRNTTYDIIKGIVTNPPQATPVSSEYVSIFDKEYYVKEKEQDHFAYLTSIKKIESRPLLPLNHKNIKIDNIEIAVSITEGLINIPFFSIIELHENVTQTYGNLSSIMLGKDLIEIITTDVSATRIKLTRINENLNGIIAHYTGRFGFKSVYYNENLESGFQVLSRNPMNNSTTLFNYVIRK
jgi:hypothetical protein